MKMCLLKTEEKAFTLVELLVVITTIALLSFIVMPIFAVRSHAGRGHIVCINNLKQVGLGLRMFSNDHDDKFPWFVSTSRGGSLEHGKSSDVFRHFLAATNELLSPRILLCPYDAGRSKASDWATFSNNNLSYFAGLDADEGKPSSVLSGDRTLSVEGTNAAGLVTIQTNSTLRIAGSFHDGRINVAFGDGSAQQMSEKQFRKLVLFTNDLPSRLAVP